MSNNQADILIQKIEDAKQEWNYKKALKIALKWLNDYINDYRIYEELADIYLHEDDIEKAEEVLKYARELHPNSWTWLFLQWYLSSAKWDFEDAIRVMEKVNELLPNNAEVIRVIGWSHIMLGKMEKGMALLRRAYAISPNDEQIIHNLNMAQLLFHEAKK